MTSRLNPEIEKIVSPVVLVIDGEKKEYASGKAAAADVFDKRYVIKSLQAVGDVIELTLVAGERFPADAGDENLFDGV